MEPTTERSALDPGSPGPRRPDRTWAIVAIAAVVLLVEVVLVVASVGDDDDEAGADAGTTTTQPESTTSATSTSSSSTSQSSTTTSPATTTRAVTAEEASTVVWPDALVGAGSDDPLELVRRFATGPLGFESPLVGELQEGDARSGEVEVRPLDDGPVTTVGVRRMSDDRYYVVFAATSEVEVIMPTPGMAIDHPLEVEGWGRGFEGRIRITVHDRATGRSLGDGFVQGGGDGDLAPFTGEVAWDNPGGGWGFVVASVSGGDDATTWAATALPVGFIGGD